MAFTPEDGTGLAGANSYISLAALKAHHDDRGNDYSGFADALLETSLVQATDYIDQRFGRRFRGDKADSRQALEWPRQNAYTDEDFLLTGVPAALAKACAEYALIAAQLGRNLAPPSPPDFGVLDPATGTVENDSSGRITQKTEKVGPIEETTKFADGNSSGGPMVGTGNLIQRIPEYPQADLWIEELIEAYTARDVYRG